MRHPDARCRGGARSYHRGPPPTSRPGEPASHAPARCPAPPARPLTLSADKLSFGIAAGVVQPSGQVRFTFSAQDADAIAEAMLAARSGSAAARRVLKCNKYVYQVAGTRERRETPTPAGICSHVKAP